MDPCIQRAIHAEPEQPHRVLIGPPPSFDEIEAQTENPRTTVDEQKCNLCNAQVGNGEVRSRSSTGVASRSGTVESIPDVVLRVEDETGSLIVDMAVDDKVSQHSVITSHSTASSGPAPRDSLERQESDDRFLNECDDAMLLASSTPKPTLKR